MPGLGSPEDGVQTTDRGKPKGPGFPSVDVREARARQSILWAEVSVAMSLLPVLP